MGFAKHWDKLDQGEFTTFRLPRKDTDWRIGECVQVVVRPRSKDRVPLFSAVIVNVESRSFDPACAPMITNADAVADGFPNGTLDMLAWLRKSHGHFDTSTIFNKITLRSLELKLVPRPDRGG